MIAGGWGLGYFGNRLFIYFPFVSIAIGIVAMAILIWGLVGWWSEPNDL
jgi:hypothetical protein